MYHPAPLPQGQELEFVEIYNAGLVAEDLGGHRLSGDWDFVFPTNTVVAAGGFVVVAPAPTDLMAAYGITGVPFFVFDGRYGVSGAQETETFRRVLEQVASDARERVP